jgi:TetR/AcrR family transcriptional regulator, repressor for neighboring sulfatase
VVTLLSMAASENRVDATTRPRGREEVRHAVLAATRGLMAERGVDGFTVRDIAERAQVNHALVHRHFGTKADVLEEVLAAEAQAVSEAVLAARPPAAASADGAAIAGLLEVLASRPTYWRALTGAVLAHPDVAVTGTRSTTDLFSGLWRDSAGRHAESAAAGAAVLGWLLFGDFMSEVASADPDEVRRVVAGVVAGLVGDGADHA